MNANSQNFLREELKVALSAALQDACKDVDLKTLDWFSYNPDFHAQQIQEKIAA